MTYLEYDRFDVTNEMGLAFRLALGAHVRAPEPSNDLNLEDSARRWIGKEPEPRKFLVDKLIPRGVLSLLVSAGGRGKTQLMLQTMICTVAGLPLCGYETAQGKAMGLFCEDDDNELHLRLKQVCEALDVDFKKIAGQIRPISCVDRNAVLWTARSGLMPLFKKLDDRLKSSPVDLLVIDGSAYVYGDNENDRGAVTRFCAALNGLAARHNIAIVLITHESKSSADNDTHAASGSTAWLNACRSVLKLEIDRQDPMKRVIKHIKTNRGRTVQPIVCRAAGGVFTALSFDQKRKRECWSFVETELAVAIMCGENLSLNPKSRNYAGRKLSERQTAADDERFSSAEIAHAIEGMIGSKFEVEAYTVNGGEHRRLKMLPVDAELAPGS